MMEIKCMPPDIFDAFLDYRFEPEYRLKIANETLTEFLVSGSTHPVRNTLDYLEYEWWIHTRSEEELASWVKEAEAYMRFE